MSYKLFLLLWLIDFLESCVSVKFTLKGATSNGALFYADMAYGFSTDTIRISEQNICEIDEILLSYVDGSTKSKRIFFFIFLYKCSLQPEMVPKSPSQAKLAHKSHLWLIP